LQHLYGTYTVNTYTTDVPGVDFEPHVDLCAKSQPSGKLQEDAEGAGAGFLKIDPYPEGVAGGVAKIKVAYNLFLLMVCMICAGHAPLGLMPEQKSELFYVYRLLLIPKLITLYDICNRASLRTTEVERRLD